MARAQSKLIYPGAIYHTSAVIKALFEWAVLYKTHNPYDDVTYLFTSYFPNKEEFLALMLTDIRVIYFFGDIDDEHAVKMINKQTEKGDDGFNMIRLTTPD